MGSGRCVGGVSVGEGRGASALLGGAGGEEEVRTVDG